MEKLTIKELAPYLPYGFKYLSPPSDLHPIFSEPKGETIETMGVIQMVSILQSEGHLKPLLRPLSQLTEEIEHNGEKINVLNELHLFQENVGLGKIIDFRNGKEIPIGEIEYGRVQTLLKYHFDVFGLIEKGLAIEISK